MNYYRHHLGDYDSHTAHLSWLEDCAYFRLLRVYYRTEKPIPADIDSACRLARATSKQERGAVAQVLSEFFELQADGWHQKRCDEEIAADQAFLAKQRQNGLASAASRRRKATTTVQPPFNDSSTTVQPPLNSGSTKSQPPTPTPTLKDSRRGASAGSDPPEPDADPEGSLDKALFAEARRIFGQSIGGLINRAIRDKGKPWVVELIEACRRMDAEQARAYLAAALRPKSRTDAAGRPKVAI